MERAISCRQPVSGATDPASRADRQRWFFAINSEPRYTRGMRAWLLCLVVLQSLATSACRSHDVPANLLNAVDFSPKEADIGDRLELLGTGFPEGKPATLTFRGSLFRPGREPLHDVEIVAPATTSSPTRIALVLSEELYAQFTGTGHDAAHTTFHGEVIGAFAPRTRGAPPISGSVADVVLDLAAPSSVVERVRAEREQGLRLLEFAGITPDPAHKHQVVIKALRAGSRAERAVLAPGDVLLEFDGVRVHGPEDLIPAGKLRSAALLVQHGRLRDPVQRSLDVDGFRAAAPAELSAATMLVGLFAAILGMFALPFGRVLTWAERRAATRLRSVKRSNRVPKSAAELTRRASSLFTNLLGAGGETPLARVALYFGFLGTTLGLTLVAFARPLVVAELDLILLLVVSSTATCVMALIVGGCRENRRWSLLLGLKHAARVVICQLPAFAAVLAVVLVSGSLRLGDIVSAQAGAPWRWHAFRNPNLLLMFLLYVASAVPEASRASMEIPELDSEQPRAESSSRPALRVLRFCAEWCSLLVASALGAILFLGGWQLPFLAPAEQQAHTPYQALGALLVVAKCWGLVGLVLLLRWTLPEVRVAQVAGFFGRWLIPAALVCVCSSLIWTRALENPALGELQTGLGAVLFALVMFVLGYFVRRVAYGMREAYTHVNVNPWL
jgi:NADH-quinone oxidoreductase subunit H